MSTYTQILYQIVFATKNRGRTLTKKERPELFKYISGILQNKKCHLYIVNGVEDHIHIVTDLHPTVALAALVKDIKLSTSEYIRRNRLFSGFVGWQDGYGAFTYSLKEKDVLIEYVKNQEAHHQVKGFRGELIEFLNQHGIIYDEKYLP